MRLCISLRLRLPSNMAAWDMASARDCTAELVCALASIEVTFQSVITSAWAGCTANTKLDIKNNLALFLTIASHVHPSLNCGTEGGAASLN
jgi:hypothetical protein